MRMPPPWSLAVNLFLGDPKKPTLHQSSAVVGSRDVDEKTRAEIQALFNRTFCLPENIDQLRMELEDFHL